MQTANRFLARANLKLSRPAKAGGYISAADTVAAAEREGLTVGQYVERLWGTEGDTDRRLSQLADLGVFDSVEHVVEIGTGTGRYMDKILDRYQPKVYESYETAGDWE